MTMPEGSTTLNVPELRRLLEKARQAKEEFAARGPKLYEAPDHESSIEWTRLSLRVGSSRQEVQRAAAEALPALLDVVEAATRVVRDMQPVSDYFHNNELGRALVKALAALDGKTVREFERSLMDEGDPS